MQANCRAGVTRQQRHRLPRHLLSLTHSHRRSQLKCYPSEWLPGLRSDRGRSG